MMGICDMCHIVLNFGIGIFSNVGLGIFSIYLIYIHIYRQNRKAAEGRLCILVLGALGPPSAKHWPCGWTLGLHLLGVCNSDESCIMGGDGMLVDGEVC